MLRRAKRCSSAAVNPLVVGSSPTRGANRRLGTSRDVQKLPELHYFTISYLQMASTAGQLQPRAGGVFVGVSGKTHNQRYPQTPMSLSDTAIKTAKPGEKPYKQFDERGLYLLVHPNGATAGASSTACPAGDSGHRHSAPQCQQQLHRVLQAL
jgi:hypothetical protein